MYKVFIFCNAMLMCARHYLPYSRYVMLFVFFLIFVCVRGGCRSWSHRLRGVSKHYPVWLVCSTLVELKINLYIILIVKQKLRSVILMQL